MARGVRPSTPKYGPPRGHGRGPVGHPAPVKDEAAVRWLISYSDFMMQLVCLFILLYSVSATDAGKTSPIAQSWREEMGLQPLNVMSDTRDSSLPLTMERLPAALRDMQVVLSRYPEGGKIRITPTADGFRLQLFYEMFEEGSGRPSRQGLRILDLAAMVLKPYERRLRTIEIVGHTEADDADREAGSSLRLSLTRAREAYRHVVSKECAHPLDPDLVVAAGRGPHEPVADNADPRSRGYNRRVEFVARLETDLAKLKARSESLKK